MLKVAILGSGQLSKMLIESSRSLAQIQVFPFCRSALDPAARSSSVIFCGDEKNPDDLKAFTQQCDVLTFESEFSSVADVKNALKSKALPTRPSLDILSRFQNKIGQKKLLDELKINSSSFFEGPLPHQVTSSSVLKQWLETAHQKLGAQLVLKWATLGYDGKGTFFASEKNQREALSFLESAQQRGIQSFAEKMINFTYEVAMTASRSVEGKISFYPLVVSEQKNGICHRVLGPAIHFGIDAELEKSARAILQKIAEASDYVGSFAIEFFVEALNQTSQKLCVNEIAPRVHNSCHYSQDACNVSQFENHMRAVSRIPVLEVTSKNYFAMLNLLGPIDLDFERIHYQAPKIEIPSQNINLHWYEKTGIRPNRKLGHINTWASSLEELKKSLLQLQQLQNSLFDSLRQEFKGGMIYAKKAVKR